MSAEEATKRLAGAVTYQSDRASGPTAGAETLEALEFLGAGGTERTPKGLLGGWANCLSPLLLRIRLHLSGEEFSKNQGDPHVSEFWPTFPLPSTLYARAWNVPHGPRLARGKMRTRGAGCLPFGSPFGTLLAHLGW